MDGDEWVSPTSNRYVTPQPGATDAWAAEAASTGQQGTQTILDVGPASAPEGLSAVLGDAPIVRRRLILLDDRPIEIAESYFPRRIAEGTPLAERKKVRGGTVSALAELGYSPTTVHERVTARTATSEEASLLGLTDHDPVLVQIRITRDAEGTAYEVAVMTMVATGRYLDYQMRTE